MSGDDLVFNWWNKYLEADCLVRAEMLSKTGFVRGVIELIDTPHKEISNDIKKRLITSQLMAIIEDCINTLESRK